MSARLRRSAIQIVTDFAPNVSSSFTRSESCFLRIRCKCALSSAHIFATARPTQQRLCLINEEYSGEIASTGYCVLRAKIDDVLPKWIFFNLSTTDFKNYVEENQSGSAYPAISDAKVKEYKIPVPPIEEQERIVGILDKFDALVNDISIGLPAEIKMRQQQYEYYRDLLLTFPPNSLSA